MPPSQDQSTRATSALQARRHRRGAHTEVCRIVLHAGISSRLVRRFGTVHSFAEKTAKNASERQMRWGHIGRGIGPDAKYVLNKGMGVNQMGGNGDIGRTAAQAASGRG